MATKTLSVILSGKDELSVKLTAVRKRMEEITESGKPMRRQLRDLQQVMADMNLNGLTDNDTFTELARQAGVYRDAISDARAATNAFADDNFSITAMSQAFSGLTGAISITTGAASMLGMEQESLDNVLRKVQGSMALVNGAQAVANALNKDSAMMQKLKQIRLLASAAAQKAYAASTATSAAATGAETVAVGASTAAHVAWNVSVAVGKALFGDLSGLILLAATGIAVYAATTSDSTAEQEKQAEATEKQKTAMESYRESLSKNTAELLGKFASLRAEWKTLRTEGEKTEWLRRNSRFLNECGVSTDNLTAAEKAFAGNSGRVVQAIKLRAQAMAAQQMIMEAYSRYMERMQALESETGGRFYYPKAYSGPHSTADDTDWRKKGLRQGADYRFMRELDGSTHYDLTSSGVEKLTAQQNAVANAQAADRYNRNAQAATATLQKEVGAATKYIEQAAAGLSNLGISLYGSSGNGSSGRSAHGRARSRGNSGNSGRSGSSAQEKPEVGSVKYYQELIDAEKKLRETRKLTAEQTTASLQKEAEYVKKRDEAEWASAHPQILDHSQDPLSIAPQASSFLPDVSELPQLPEIPLDGYDEAQSKLEALRGTLSSLSGEIGSQASRWGELAGIFSNDMATGAEKAGAAMVVAGDSLKALGEDSVAAKAGAVAAAIGQLILGYTTATAQAANLGPFGWLAFLGAGLAAVSTVIGTIKGFADGGIVGGNSFHGDSIVARVNAGEMVLNRRQQGNLFRLLDSNNGGASGKPATVRFVLTGDQLQGCLSNHQAKMGLA